MDSFVAYAESVSGDSSLMAEVYGIALVVGLWKMFEKAGEPGWIGLVPFYNSYKLCEITMGQPWYWVRIALWAFVPIIGWAIALYHAYQLAAATAAAFGKPKEWAWGYFFFAPIFYCVTGFDSNIEYYGPYGSGDYRTDEARRSQTVDFEVIKEEERTTYSSPDYYEPEPADDEPIRTEILINGVPYREDKKSSDVFLCFDNE